MSKPLPSDAPPDEEVLHESLAAADIPSLALALVHLTGSTEHLKRMGRPVYRPSVDNQGGFSAEQQALLRAEAFEALKQFFAGQNLAPAPDVATVREMMNFAAGADIPDAYMPMLLEELGLVLPNIADDQARPIPSSATAKRVVVIGAGLSGLLMGYRLKEAGIPFEIIERNDDVGGTWLENRYPGCRVDSPNHLYSYSFEPNHEWPYHYSTQDLLLDYFRRFADRHYLRPHIRLGTRVTALAFDAARSRWTVTLEADGRQSTVEADMVVSAVGQLNEPKIPEIAGAECFGGLAIHSARWPEGLDATGKRVAVIGTGATAFQLVPALAGKAKHVTVFQRTPPWLGPRPDYHAVVAPGKKWLMRNVPFYDRWYRFQLFWKVTDGIYDSIRIDPEWRGPAGTISAQNKRLRDAIVREIARQCDGDEALMEAVIPRYAYGGKRALLDNGLWISSLKRPDVTMVPVPVEQIESDGVRAGGVLHEADLIVYATGFRASEFLRTIEVRGRDGVELHDAWQGDARAYLGMTVPGFPNFFMLYGPNTNLVVNGSTIFFVECSVRYIMDCIALMAEREAMTMDVRVDVYEEYNERVDAQNRTMAWGAPDVNSWYKNENGRVTQNWPFPLIDYWTATRRADPEDFRIG